MKKMGAALAATVLLLTAGCGGGGRPSADELSKSLQKGADVQGQNLKLPKKQADCVAKLLVDSDLSDEALRAIEKRDTKYKASDKDTKAINGLSDDARKCATS